LSPRIVTAAEVILGVIGVLTASHLKPQPSTLNPKPLTPKPYIRNPEP